jgi:Cu-Zn family superoxide dismutase
MSKMNKFKCNRTLSLTIGMVLVLAAITTLAATAAIAGNGAMTTSGTFSEFPLGDGDIDGHATMVRVPSGKTIVSVHVTGLMANTTYGSHVHNAPCSTGGGGHYQDVVGGPVDNVNEIWPAFSTNAAGIGNGKAMNGFIARPEAQSVVIHAPGGARIACADLS